MPRPFDGLADEPEWIALRELVPAASAPLRLAPDLVEEFGDRPVTLATVLPMAAPAMTKPDGRVFIGLQRHQQSGDVSRDLAEALLCALRTEPGGQVAVPPLPGPGPRLQDVLVDGPLEITMHDGLRVLAGPGRRRRPDRAGVAGAGERGDLPDGAAGRGAGRVLVPGAGEGARALGAAGRRGRRAGRAGPARRGRHADRWASRPGSPACSGRTAGWCRSGTCRRTPRRPSGRSRWREFAKRYAEALADTGPLDAAGRRARQGLLGRQLTLR